MFKFDYFHNFAPHNSIPIKPSKIKFRSLIIHQLTKFRCLEPNGMFKTSKNDEKIELPVHRTHTDITAPLHPNAHQRALLEGFHGRRLMRFIETYCSQLGLSLITFLLSFL